VKDRLVPQDRSGITCAICNRCCQSMWSGPTTHPETQQANSQTDVSMVTAARKMRCVKSATVLGVGR